MVLHVAARHSADALAIDAELQLRDAGDRPCERGPGDIVCGVASFGSSAVPWEARATLPTRVLSFASEQWFDLMEEHFDMVRSTLAAIAERRAILIEFLAEKAGGIVFT